MYSLKSIFSPSGQLAQWLRLLPEPGGLDSIGLCFGTVFSIISTVSLHVRNLLQVRFMVTSGAFVDLQSLLQADILSNKFVASLLAQTKFYLGCWALWDSALLTTHEQGSSARTRLFATC
ncbi:hypothetical protein AVEN_248627-1 [Araneus ventricosus]|uniref:Uncharacterized protein n=1 Tax=Araneus ventricosus TaxID=182803 RepID=A0A4Y2RDX9_ARAVE|nr:hypothetical protein AVEN_248627-1 [Araneus ventricosus]